MAGFLDDVVETTPPTKTGGFLDDVQPDKTVASVVSNRFQPQAPQPQDLSPNKIGMRNWVNQVADKTYESGIDIGEAILGGGTTIGKAILNKIIHPVQTFGGIQQEDNKQLCIRFNHQSKDLKQLQMTFNKGLVWLVGYCQRQHIQWDRL